MWRARLVRSEFTPRGPRQRAVLYLGSIDERSRERPLPAHRFWQKVSERLQRVDATEEERTRWRDQLAAKVPVPDPAALAQAQVELEHWREGLRALAQVYRRR